MAFQNPYATRLEEFSSFAFNEPTAGRCRGDWARYFAERMGRAPSCLVLELGCSNAVFLAELAVNNPDVAFIGLDWKFKVLYKGAKRVAELGLKNVALLRARAQELPRFFAEGEIDEIWLFFSDPWAKKSQRKNRLLQNAFLTDAHQTLRSGGAIHFKTDHPGYFQWVLALFGVPRPALRPYDASTEERSRRARQIKVRRLEDEDDLPPPSETARRLFSLANVTMDYWREPHLPARLFSGRATLFERIFVAEGLPIYYLEMNRRC